MALFKIFNNISSKNDLPNYTVQGYCYFDAVANLFYIDIADCDNLNDAIANAGLSKTDPQDADAIDALIKSYRVPLNAANANFATKAYKDLNGNVISDTYATMAYVLEHLNDGNFVSVSENQNNSIDEQAMGRLNIGLPPQLSFYLDPIDNGLNARVYIEQ